jgi:hypothetical protein
MAEYLGGIWVMLPVNSGNMFKISSFEGMTSEVSEISPSISSVVVAVPNFKVKS